MRESEREKKRKKYCIQQKLSLFELRLMLVNDCECVFKPDALGSNYVIVSAVELETCIHVKGDSNMS